MNSTRITLTTWGLLAALSLIWGGSFLAIRTALDEVPPLSSVAHRVLWATIALWVVALARGITLPRDPKIWGALLVMGCLNNVVPFSLMAWGQLHIETGLTSILNASTAIWGVVVAAMVFRDERLTAQKTVGILTGFTGVVVALGIHNVATLDLRSLAQLAVIGGTVSYALAGSWARTWLKDLSPLAAALGMLSGSTLIMVPLAWLLEGPLPMELKIRTWFAIGYYSLVATALAYLLYYAILSRAGAGLLLVVTLMIPPVAILLGAWVRHETLGADAFGGFVFLAIGLVFLGLRPRHGARKSRSA